MRPVERRSGRSRSGRSAPLLRGRGGYYIAALAVLCLAAGLAASVSSYRDKTRWAQAEATSMRAELIAFRKKGTTYYRPEVEFSYVLKGDTYIVPFSHPQASSDQGVMQEVLIAYAPGSTHTIFYDPSNPYTVDLDLATRRFFLLPLGLTAAGVTLSALFILLFVRQGRFACSRCFTPASRHHRFCRACGSKMTRRKGTMRA